MTSWGTTGFSNTHVNQLTNGNMLPFIFSVACVNGAFHSGDCFAEAWLRKENGGSVMALMATINQPWQPPMRGQDYFNDLLTGGYNYATNPGNGTSTTEGRTVLGSVIVNGLVLMYAESASTSDLQTIQTWTTFGDASLQARTKAPSTITLSNTSLTAGLSFETVVSVNGSPFKGALVSISQNGNYFSAYSNQTGAVSIPNTFTPGNVLLVVTGFNTQTIYQTIQCTAASGPAIYFDHAVVNDGNNGRLDYGETAGLNIAMKNTGVDPAQNVSVSLSSPSSYLTILNPTANFGFIAPGQIVTVANAFTIEVATNVPNGEFLVFYLNATDGGSSWQSSFALTAYAGQLSLDQFSISDLSGNGNGKLDPGEAADLIVSVKNSGSSVAFNIDALLSTSNPYITIGQSQVNYGNLSSGQSTSRSFQVTASPGTPVGQNATFELNLSADLGLTLQTNFDIVVGQIPILIIDLDKNHNSWDKISVALDELDMTYSVSTSIPANLDIYSSIFLCLGIYPNNHVLTQAQGQIFADFLTAGGKMYVEGGDTWYYDAKTPMHYMFGINATSDGSSDLGTIVGHTGTFAQGMSFGYGGENTWIDRLNITGNGVMVLSNVSPAYGTAVINDAGSYKTIGASHEFGGLTGNRTPLIEGYLDFLGLLPPPLTSQTIMIPVGWSGLSSCLIPQNANIETLLDPIMNELTILYSLDGIFYPEQGMNTIINWNYQNGYMVKMNAPIELEITGWHNEIKQLQLQPGWNLIPVMSDCETDVAGLFESIIDNIDLVKEIAGAGIYWPAMNINTLGTLISGRSYYVHVNSPVMILFPECE
jgi:hypothetical protein